MPIFLGSNGFIERAGFLPPEKVDNTVSCNTKEPRRDVFDGPGETVRREQLVEDVLENVLRIRGISDVPANEAAQTGLVSLHDLGEKLILFADRPVMVHLLVLTDREARYFMNFGLREYFFSKGPPRFLLPVSY